MVPSESSVVTVWYRNYVNKEFLFHMLITRSHFAYGTPCVLILKNSIIPGSMSWKWLQLNIKDGKSFQCAVNTILSLLRWGASWLSNKICDILTCLASWWQNHVNTLLYYQFLWTLQNNIKFKKITNLEVPIRFIVWSKCHLIPNEEFVTLSDLCAQIRFQCINKLRFT